MPDGKSGRLTTFPPRGGELICYSAGPAPIWKETDMEMAFDTIGFTVALTAVLAFLWNLHRDIGALNKDMGALRQDMRRDIGALRQDMNRDIGSLRQDIGGLHDRMSRVENRVSRVEGMLTGAGLKINPEPASG